MNSECVIEECKEPVIKNYQFCKKHYEQYADIADSLPKDIRKHTKAINDLRTAILDAVIRHSIKMAAANSDDNGIDIIIALASSAAQIVAAKTSSDSRPAAKVPDITYTTFKMIFDAQYKLAIYEINKSLK